MRRSKIKPSFFLPDSIPGANLKRMSKIAFKTEQFYTYDSSNGKLVFSTH
jgi:hypothetical protein